jgi:hypothetical protein
LTSLPQWMLNELRETMLWGRSMTSRNNSHKRGKVLEEDDVVHLLSAAIEREGGQSAFARRYGVDRSGINMILHGKKRVNDSVAAVLGQFGCLVNACTSGGARRWTRPNARSENDRADTAATAARI